METIDQTRLRIEAFIKEKAPTVDLSPGSVLSELLTKLTAEAQNENRNNVATIEAAKTVKDVLEATEDTFSPTIDRLASNFNTYRNQGSKAAGQIKVVVNRAKSYFLPAGFTFIQPNLNFAYATTADFSINATSSPPLKQDGELYYFVIPVEASEVGREKQVAYGTKFALDSNSPLPEFVEASAAGAFTQGDDTESDRELITRFRLGLSTKNLISPTAIEAVLRDIFPTFRGVSVRGIGDPEEIRGRNNPLGIALPGMVDVFIRMSDALPIKTVTLTGTKGGDGRWTVVVPANSVPGFYRVLSISVSGGTDIGTNTFHSVTYSYDTSVYTKANTVASINEARFSKYQSCTLVFDYTLAGSTANFDVKLLYQPLIEDVQALFLDNNTRIPCADYLVKGVTPCNVAIEVHITKKDVLDDFTDNLQKIKIDIFTYINSLPIGEPIVASEIVKICHKYNIKKVNLPIILKGSIIVPYSNTDEYVYISGTDNLTIPYLPEKGITPYTTSFFTNYFDEYGNEAIGVVAT